MTHRPASRLRPLLLAFALVACEGPTGNERPITGPYSIRIVSGADQAIARGADAAAEVVVELLDVHGRPAPGIPVRWPQEVNGVTFPNAAIVTGPDGRAAARLRASCSAWSGTVAVAASTEAANEAALAFTVITGPPVALFAPDTAHLVRGEVATATVSPRDACGTLAAPVAVAWASTADAIVTVGGSGVTSRSVTAGSSGRAGVVATAGGFTDTLHVAVHAPVTGMRTLALGSGYGCGLDDAGDVHCWGWSGGTAADESTGPRQDGARRVLTGDGFTRIVGSGPRLCALDRNGVAYCWGSGAGLIGDGASVARLAPVAVGGGLRFVDIAAGSSHACGITAAGDAWCWGLNANGQLGDGTTTARLVPVAVATTEKFTHVAVASRFTCALTAAGATWCWGDGPDPWGSYTSQAVTTPALLAGAPPLAKLAAGWTNACGLSVEGEAWCWGYSPPHFLEQFLPVVNSPPTRIEGTRSYTSIAVGAAHACATTAAGAVDCWGANEKAQLGSYAGATPKRWSAAPVAVDPLAKVFAPASGNSTCGVTPGGNVYCWGEALAALAHPGALTCAWGSGIAARNYLCTLPRAVPAALP